MRGGAVHALCGCSRAGCLDVVELQQHRRPPGGYQAVTNPTPPVLHQVNMKSQHAAGLPYRWTLNGNGSWLVNDLNWRVINPTVCSYSVGVRR